MELKENNFEEKKKWENIQDKLLNQQYTNNINENNKKREYKKSEVENDYNTGNCWACKLGRNVSLKGCSPYLCQKHIIRTTKRNIKQESSKGESEMKKLESYLVLAIIVMHDAMGVRLETGKQAKVLNALLQENPFKWEGEVLENNLKELVGHTPLQVVAGAILGVLVGVTINWLAH